MKSVIKCRLFISEQRLFRDGKSCLEMISGKDSLYNRITVIRDIVHNNNRNNNKNIINTTTEE